MKPVSPVLPRQPELKEIVIGKDQEGVEPLPAIPLNGWLLSRWQLTDDEVAQIVERKEVYLWQFTNGGMMQAISLQTEIPGDPSLADQILDAEELDG